MPSTGEAFLDLLTNVVPSKILSTVAIFVVVISLTALVFPALHNYNITIMLSYVPNILHLSVYLPSPSASFSSLKISFSPWHLTVGFYTHRLLVNSTEDRQI